MGVPTEPCILPPIYTNSDEPHLDLLRASIFEPCPVPQDDAHKLLDPTLQQVAVSVPHRQDLSHKPARFEEASCATS